MASSKPGATRVSPLNKVCARWNLFLNVSTESEAALERHAKMRWRWSATFHFNWPNNFGFRVLSFTSTDSGPQSAVRRAIVCFDFQAVSEGRV